MLNIDPKMDHVVTETSVKTGPVTEPSVHLDLTVHHFQLEQWFGQLTCCFLNIQIGNKTLYKKRISIRPVQQKEWWYVSAFSTQIISCMYQELYVSIPASGFFPSESQYSDAC